LVDVFSGAAEPPNPTHTTTKTTAITPRRKHSYITTFLQIATNGLVTLKDFGLPDDDFD
jgi:hypothetical protein